MWHVFRACNKLAELFNVYVRERLEDKLLAALDSKYDIISVEEGCVVLWRGRCGTWKRVVWYFESLCSLFIPRTDTLLETINQLAIDYWPLLLSVSNSVKLSLDDASKDLNITSWLLHIFKHKYRHDIDNILICIFLLKEWSGVRRSYLAVIWMYVCLSVT